MVKIRVNGETKEEKFRRIAEARANKILSLMSLLRNCSSTSTYSYSDSQINKIFKALEDELRLTKLAFQSAKHRKPGIRL